MGSVLQDLKQASLVVTFFVDHVICLGRNHGCFRSTRFACSSRLSTTHIETLKAATLSSKQHGANHKRFAASQARAGGDNLSGFSNQFSNYLRNIQLPPSPWSKHVPKTVPSQPKPIRHSPSTSMPSQCTAHPPHPLSREPDHIHQAEQSGQEHHAELLIG